MEAILTAVETNLAPTSLSTRATNRMNLRRHRIGMYTSQQTNKSEHPLQVLPTSPVTVSLNVRAGPRAPLDSLLRPFWPALLSS